MSSNRVLFIDNIGLYVSEYTEQANIIRGYVVNGAWSLTIDTNTQKLWTGSVQAGSAHATHYYDLAIIPVLATNRNYNEIIEAARVYL